MTTKQDSWTVLPYPQDPYTDDLFNQPTVVNSPYDLDRYGRASWTVAEQLDHTLVDDRYVNDRYVRDEQPTWYGLTDDTVTAAVARQRRLYGGVKLGSTFFGLLTAVSMALLLAGLAAAAVAGFVGGVSVQTVVQTNLAGASIGAAVVLTLIVVTAFFSGGYVAARMARFSGAAHGIAVWASAVAVTTLITWAAAAQEGRFDLAAFADALNAGQPSLSLSPDVLARVSLVAAAILALTALTAAVLGGAAGDRYHRRIDRAAGLGPPRGR